MEDTNLLKAKSCSDGLVSSTFYAVRGFSKYFAMHCFLFNNLIIDAGLLK